MDNKTKKFIDYASYKAVGDKLFDVVKKNTSIETSYEAFKDTSWIERTMLNTYQFAAAKDLSECMALRTVAFQSENFKDYKEKAKEIVDLNRDQYFRVEYDSAERCAVMGESWRKIEESKEMFPYWVYRGVMDDVEREEHVALEGLIFRIGDPEGDAVYPPCDYNCFKPETLISTPNGLKRIDSLNIGDIVFSGGGYEQTINFVHINKFDGELIKIINKRGSVFCTKNHRILTIEGWKFANDINPGDTTINKINLIRHNNAIVYIKNCYSFARYVIMSLIVKRNSVDFKTFNSNIQFRNKNINPIWAKIEIMFNLISQRINIIYHNLLTFCRFSPGINMSFGMQSISSFGTNNTFSSDFGTQKTGINFLSFRLKPILFRIKFIFANAGMRNFCNIASHIFSSLLFPFICIYPLSLYCFSSFSDWYIKVVEKNRHKSIITNIPAFSKFFTRMKLNRIKFIKNIGSGTFLDRFNSRYVFLYSLFFHNELNLVTETKIEKYSGNIYNLSINNDETYITEIGIVHNCRCAGDPIDESEIPEGGNVSEGKDYLTENDPDTGKPYVAESFRFNPGNQVNPNEGSYFDVMKSANKADYELFSGLEENE